MPEFGRVVALMQFNMYHHYTVDEHLLLAVGNVAASNAASCAANIRSSRDLIKRIKSREVLYVADLLHDMAKGLPGDHSDVGAAMAESVCPRLGLSAADTATVSWLVRNHLVMSDAAQKRDIADPQDGARFRSCRADAGEAAAAADAHRRRYSRRRARRVERLEGPAAARTLLRSRDADVGRRRAAGARRARRRGKARAGGRLGDFRIAARSAGAVAALRQLLAGLRAPRSMNSMPG